MGIGKGLRKGGGWVLTGNTDEMVVVGANSEMMNLRCPVAVMAGKTTELTWDFVDRELVSGSMES